MSRLKIIPAVFLLLIKQSKIFMLRRFNTGYEDGSYTLPSGHLNGGESLKQAMIREAYEEVGIKVNLGDLKLAQVMSRNAEDGERVDFFFIANNWKGEPMNNEKEKCDDAQWFSLDRIPHNTVFFVRKAIENYKDEINYSELEWQNYN